MNVVNKTTDKWMNSVPVRAAEKQGLGPAKCFLQALPVASVATTTPGVLLLPLLHPPLATWPRGVRSMSGEGQLHGLQPLPLPLGAEKHKGYPLAYLARRDQWGPRVLLRADERANRGGQREHCVKTPWAASCSTRPGQGPFRVPSAGTLYWLPPASQQPGCLFVFRTPRNSIMHF